MTSGVPVKLVPTARCGWRLNSKRLRKCRRYEKAAQDNVHTHTHIRIHTLKLTRLVTQAHTNEDLHPLYTLHC